MRFVAALVSCYRLPPGPCGNPGLREFAALRKGLDEFMFPAPPSRCSS